MSRYYDYTNGISWQNQSLAGAGVGVGGQKESRGPPQPPLYPHAPHPAYTSAAQQDSRVVMPVPPGSNPLYSQSIYNQYHSANKSQVPIPASRYPVLPDVRLKRLPFYDILADIMKPSSLLPNTTQRPQETMFTFYLTPQQATDIATGRDIVGINNKLENIVQVQLRFCVVETSSDQEDFFPPSCAVKINNKMCPLPNPIPTNKPGVEPKRPPRPVNITSFLKLSPTVSNTMSVSWATDFTKNYAVSVTLVRKLTSQELLNRLKSKGTKHSDYTRSLIKEKLREDLDCEIATTSLRVSLVCPLGKMRMICPCRPATCLHLQCFDASLFLQMNERKPTWLCPVCDKPALYDNLVVDGYFQEVLDSPELGSDCCEVQLHKDGSWSPHLIKKESDNIATPVKEACKLKVELIDDLEVIPLSDGSNCSVGPPAKVAGVVGAGEAPEPRVVDLCGSDSEDDLPLKRKPPKSGRDEPQSSDAVIPPHIKYNDGSCAATGVSSSGYCSPAPSVPGPAPPSPVRDVISLDSPSPPPAPASPQPAHQASMPYSSFKLYPPY